MNKRDLCVLVMTALLGVTNVSYADTQKSNEPYIIKAAEQKEQVFTEAENVSDAIIDEGKVKANKETLDKAQSAFDNKDYQSTIVYTTIYINSKPKKYEAYQLRGDAFYALHQFQLAQRDYQTAIDLKTADDKLMTGTKYVSAIILGADKNEQLQNTELGNLYGRLMYAQKAQNDSKYEESFANAVKYNSHIYLPQPNKNDINKINCPQKYGKVVNPQGIDATISKAIEDIEKDNFHEAIFKIQEINEKYPKYYLGQYLMGVALTGLEQTDDAIKSFEQALKLNPYDFESLASLGQIYFDRAETNFSKEDAQKSIDYFNQALKYHKNNNTYYFYIGMNELQMGNNNLAISNFNKALKINPNDYNSQYYKSIAQYINGDYSNVIDGTTKLLYKHVSNYNSVLFLRALANYEQKSYAKAISDLDTIQNSIDDIYNSDVKVISNKEKTLESYIYYLRDKIAKVQGTADRANLAQAYKNPIVAKLAKAEEAMTPYENIMNESTVSLRDYEKFNDFYSTSLPKLLGSDIEITADDIDNQYDYIRTTFKDLGVSFKYLNPNYKITTIENYPYKKYASKLNNEDKTSVSEEIPEDIKQETSLKPVLELKSTTSQADIIGDSAQTSLAQMLASNALANKPYSMNQKTIQKPIKEELTEVPSTFVPETPAAEKLETSSNIASGDSYAQTGKPSLLNENNDKDVKNILKEEKEIQPLKLPENNQSQAQGVKITADELKETPDVVVRHTPVAAPIIQESEKIEENINKIEQTANGYKLTADQIKETPDVVVKHTKAAAQEVAQTTKNIENNIAETTNGYKLTATEVQQTPDIVIKYKEPVDTSGLPDITKQNEFNVEKTIKDIEQIPQQVSQKVENTINHIEQPIKEIEQNIQTTKQEIEKAVQTVKEPKTIFQTPAPITEKYADINPEDFGVQTKELPVLTPQDDIVELNSKSLLNDMGLDNDFMEQTKQNINNAKTEVKNFGNNFGQNIKKDIFNTTSALTEPVLLEEEDIMPLPAKVQNEPVAVPVVTVPELEYPKVDAETQKIIQETAPVIPPALLQERPAATMEDVETKAKEELNKIVPKVNTPEVVEQPIISQPEINTPIVDNEPLTREKLQAEKARLQKEIEEQREQLRLAKEKAKNDAKAQKILEQEKAKAQKAQEKWEKNIEKTLEKAKEKEAKEAAKAEKLAAKEQAKLQKEAQKARAAAAQEQAKIEKETAKAKEEAAEQKVRLQREAEKNAAQAKEKAQKAEEKLNKEREKLVSSAQKEKDNSEEAIRKIKAKTEKTKTQAEKDALKAQLKAERKQAQMEAKARRAAQKAAQKEAQAKQKADDINKKSPLSAFFSKFKRTKKD